MSTLATVIVIAVVVLVLLAVVALVIRRKNREANIARAEQLRTEAATRAQSTLPPVQDRAAEAEAKAEEARVVAERARAEAEEARVAAAQAEAEHEAQVRAADRLDPRVDHKAKDYEPQVAGTVDQQPTVTEHAVTEHAVTEHADERTTDQTPDQSAGSTPLLPRRTPGANDMPGRPMESDGTSGGWFTRKDS